MVLGKWAALEFAITNLALKDPALHANHTVGRARFGKAVFDLGTQRMQRHSTVSVPLPASHLSATKAARALDPDAFGTELHRRDHRLLHGASESDSAFELCRDVLRDQLCVEFRFSDLFDVDENITRGVRLELLAKHVDLSPTLADQDAGACGVDINHDLLAGAFDDDLRDPRVIQLLLDEGANLHVFMQLRGVVLFGEPIGLPPVKGADPEAVWMDFLTHVSDYLSDSTTLMLAVRFWIQAARP